MDRTSLGLGAAVITLVGSGVGATYIGMSPDNSGPGGSGGTSTQRCDPVTAEKAQTAAPRFVEKYSSSANQLVVYNAAVKESKDGVGLLVTVPQDSPLQKTVTCFQGVPVTYMVTKG